MIPFVLQTLRSLGPSLTSWAVQIHAVALTLLVAAWCAPVVEALFNHFFRTEKEREEKKKESEIEWVKLWLCPKCNTYNRRSFSNCTHCEYALKADDSGTLQGRSREWFFKNAKRVLSIYSFIGWILFYGLTIYAFVSLNLYRYRQPALLQVLASITLILALISLLYFYLALRPRKKSPIGALMHLSSGIIMTMLFSISLLTWMEASAPAAHVPLAYVRMLNAHEIKLQVRGGKAYVINGIPVQKVKENQFDLNYAILSWPCMGVRHVYLTRFSGNPLWSDRLLWLEDLVASHMNHENYYTPRLRVFAQRFQIPPQGSYSIHELPDDTVLTLTQER